MSYGYIYKTTNLLNGRVYIGQKKGNVNSSYLGSGKIIEKAVNKYGRNNFLVEILAFASDKLILNQMEIKYISEYRKIFGRFMYNICNGGEGNTSPRTKEAIEKMVKTITGKKKPAQSLALKGRKHKQECACGFCAGSPGNKNGMWKDFGNKLDKEVLYQKYVIEKKNAREISILQGCSETTIKRFLRKYGLMRSKSEALTGIKKNGKVALHGK